MATRALFGTTKDGRRVYQYTLAGQNGLAVHCIDYGCRITGLMVPGERGAAADIVLGYDSFEEYENDTSFQGAFVGRYANRIGGAQFTLNGKKHVLLTNEGGNYLHGSFHKRIFEAQIIGENSVSFTYISPDGEDGFPGELWVGVTYTLTDQNEFVIDYRAVPTEDTYVNFTNHSYFNLAGAGSGSVEGQLLSINSTTILEVDAAKLPTGQFMEVGDGPFDFTEEKTIGRDLHSQNPLLETAGGYDHCYVLDKQTPRALALAATAKDPASGRSMQVYTTQPGVQLYTGNMLSGIPGKAGKPLAAHSGFCLETQHYPDSPAHPAFPSTLLRAGEKYHEVTLLRF